MEKHILSGRGGRSASRRKQLEALGAIALLLVLVARWQRSWYYVYAAAAILLAGLAWKEFAEVLRRYWMKLGEALGFVTGKVLLTIVYILIVLPLSFFARRSGKLSIRLKGGAKTNFKYRAHVYGEEDFRNPW